MTFKTLSGFFGKLEETSSRNAMVEILAELFSNAKEEEIKEIVYLTQGRVAPLFEPVEFGIAEKMVARAIANAFGVEVEKVNQDFKKTGDLGAVASSLSNSSGLGDLRVIEIFDKLLEITKISGDGSVEKKIMILADILQNVDSLSVKYVARIPVDKMRLGFSDMTVLEGLSWMIDGTKKNKPLLESAYNIRPDLGFIAEQVKKCGIAGVAHVKPEIGTPILVMRAERLNSPEAIVEEIGKCAVEPKLDGLRTQLHLKKGLFRLFSRGMENVTDMYPDLLAASQEELKNYDEVILDGEAIGFDTGTGKYLPFQETTQRKRKHGIEEASKNIPVRFVVFDLLYKNRESYMEKPYTERRKEVEKLSGPIIEPAEMRIMDDPEVMENFFLTCLSNGLEGIMAKKLDGVYQAGARGWNWIKLKGSYTEKLDDTIDAVVMGVDFGQGKRSNFGVGAFLVGIYDKQNDSFKTISKIGTGLTDQEWSDLSIKSEKLKVKEKPKNYNVNKIMEPDIWVKPVLVGEFRADELTKSPMHTAGFAMRFPRLVRWREKKAEDTTSLKEIFEMVNLQKR